MSEGEKMIWAASYALSYSAVAPVCDTAERRAKAALVAIDAATRAVDAFRSVEKRLYGETEEHGTVDMWRAMAGDE